MHSAFLPTTIHIDDIGERVGTFKAGGMVDGIAIKSWNPMDTEVRERRELRQRITFHRLCEEIRTAHNGELVYE